MHALLEFGARLRGILAELLGGGRKGKELAEDVLQGMTRDNRLFPGPPKAQGTVCKATDGDLGGFLRASRS